MTHYRVRFDDQTGFGPETPVSVPITRSDVPAGLRTIEVEGRNAAGTWQASATTASFHMATTTHEPVACTLKSAGGVCDMVLPPSASFRSYRTNEFGNAPNCGGDCWGTQVPNPGPGGVVCLQAGTHRGFIFSGFRGSPQQPLTVVNCGGQVNVTSQPADYGATLKLNGGQDVRIVGTGSAETYGIRIDSGTTNTDSSNALEVTTGSSSVEVAFVEVAGASYAGISFRTNISCNFNRSNFSQDNTFLHHNHVHDTHGEGFYVGGSHWNYQPPSTAGGCDVNQCKCGCICGGVTQLESELHGVRIHDNLVEDTYADGIQVGSAVDNTEIYDNRIYRALQGGSGFNSGAFSINSGTRGRIYRNVVTDAAFGVAIFGPGDTEFYNNVVVGPEAGALTCVAIYNGANAPGAGFRVLNNNLLRCGNEGVFMYQAQSVGNLAHNNIVLGATTPFAFNGTPSAYDWTASHNITGPQSLAATYFANPAAGDFCHLAPGTDAVDTGLDVSAWGVADDLDGLTRNDGAYDIGACEFRP